MTQPFPAPAPKGRVLSNMYLPAVEGYAIRCFGDYLPPPAPGAPPASVWRAEMERRDLADILPLIPAAEKPDILVCASPEYLPIPWDIHAFRGPKVLLITDWNVCLRFLPDLCPLFDFCFTDWPGYRLLRKAGVANVFHQPLFGHDPGRFRLLGGRGRDLDVSFCGNLNAGLHGERNRLLARMARWAHRTGRPVHLRQAFDDAYVDVLNRSRLVFNYSIRGEANMRLFEAMACGAAPLVEETNQEVAILFQENRHYFRYPLGGLEAKLDELLADPDRIAGVAEAAQREVGRFTKAKQLEALLDAVGRDGGPRAGTAASSASSPITPSPAGRKTLAKIRILGMGYTAPEAMQEIQARATECPGLDLEVLPGLLLAVVARSQDRASGPARSALNHLLRNPVIPEFLRHFHRLQEARCAGDWNSVESYARQCLSALAQADRSHLEPGGALYATLLHPVGLGEGMNSDINRAFLGGLAENRAAGKALLEMHCKASLMEAARTGGSASGIAFPEETGGAPLASIDRHRLRLDLARRAGDVAAIQSACRAWFEECPLDTRAWSSILDAYGHIGDRADRTSFLRAIHVLSMFFLDSEQSDRILRLLSGD